MKEITFPCWKENAKIMLADVLAQLVFDRAPNWSLFEISYAGQAPQDLSHEEFERLVRTSASGYSMSHKELLDFAQRIHDIDEFEAKGKISDATVIELEAHDSTLWQIRYDETSVRYVELTDDEIKEIAERRSDMPLRGSSRNI